MSTVRRRNGSPAIERLLPLLLPQHQASATSTWQARSVLVVALRLPPMCHVQTSKTSFLVNSRCDHTLYLEPLRRLYQRNRHRAQRQDRALHQVVCMATRYGSRSYGDPITARRAVWPETPWRPARAKGFANARAGPRRSPVTLPLLATRSSSTNSTPVMASNLDDRTSCPLESHVPAPLPCSTLLLHASRHLTT